jgi:protocatechuate 3,4-dioxygenase beta subunit
MKTRKTIFLAVILVALVSGTFASNEKDGEAELLNTATTSINGKVIDKNTGEALTGAKIIFEGIGVTTYTDFDGNFSIKGIKPGKYNVSTSLISYSNRIAEIELNTVDSENVEIELESVNK